MDLKKNPEVNVEKKKHLLFQVGLVTALAVILIAFEWKTFNRSVSSLGQLQVELEEEELIPITQQEPPPPPPPPPQTTTYKIQTYHQPPYHIIPTHITPHLIVSNII